MLLRSVSTMNTLPRHCSGYFAHDFSAGLNHVFSRMGNASCAQALATRNCSACASDAAASKVAVVANAAHSEDLYIYSHSKVCERKTTGGDAWVVEVRGWDFHHGQSQEKVRALKMVWRAPAKDLGDGRYVAHLPHLLFETGLAVGVSVSLWWTRADPSWSLEHSWNQTRVSTWDAQSQSFRACAHALPSPHLAPKYIIREALEQQEQHLPQCHSAEDPLRCTAAIAATYKLHAHGQQLHGGWSSLYPWRFDSRLVPLLGGTPLRSVPNRSTDGTVDSFESNLDHGAHRCPPGSQGRWLSSEARREPGLDPAKEGAAALRGDQMHWVPWGCRASSACFDGLAIRTCLGRRRLVLLGDSVSAGTFLDICSALGGGKQCAVFNWATGTLPPQAVVAFSPSTGLPPRQGLLNLFGSTDPDGEVLERLLTRANNTIVVFQSGLHDISTLGGSHVRHRIAPLLTYQYHLRKLARVLSTVRQRNPTATFVWKQTTYPRAFTSPLQADLRDYPERALNSSRGSVDKARAARTSVSLCRDLAFPATYTPLIEKLNQAARELFAPMGVLIWEEPALMTFTAPDTCFPKDPTHFDACGAGAEKFDVSQKAGRCALYRMNGGGGRPEWGRNATVKNNKGSTLSAVRPAEQVQTLPWAGTGGLSEAVTQTLFPLLNCTCG